MRWLAWTCAVAWAACTLGCDPPGATPQGTPSSSAATTRSSSALPDPASATGPYADEQLADEADFAAEAEREIPADKLDEKIAAMDEELTAAERKQDQAMGAPTGPAPSAAPSAPATASGASARSTTKRPPAPQPRPPAEAVPDKTP